MDGPLLRMLDANANRAREGLRVVEDYARFVLDDDRLSHDLKTLRHALSESVGPYVARAILHRDTPGDVGTDNKTAAEGARQDLAAVVTAAGKRLGEALRVIEEVLKTQSAGDGLAVEAVRYQWYALEQAVARTLRPGRFRDVRLYVLITEAQCKRPWLEAAEEAIRGGADCLQLREKDLESGELLRRAYLLVALCRRHGALCVINDRPDVAVLSRADGVHVGQGDLPAAAVRKVIGREMILGVSTHEMEQARQAVRDGADYIGVGPFFRSATKPRDFVAGPAYARAAASAIPIPAVAIAGITAANVDEVLATGVRAVAVTAAVVGAADVRAAARALKMKLTGEGIPDAARVAEAAVAGPDLGRANPVAQAFLPVVPQTFLSVSAPHPRREPELEISRRNLPHWRLDGATYFVTFRVRSGALNEAERRVVLEHVRSGHGRFYSLLGAVIMPDHAHLILRPNPGVDLPRITKGTKGVTARLVNQMRGESGPFWLDESWDRIIRDQAELEEKLKYVFDNPVKAGLVEDSWAYEGLFINPDVD